MTDLSPKIQHHHFADSAALAESLAAAVADDLRAGVAAHGQASVALSGGNTPKRFMQALSQQPLDWDKIVVTLVDERWVPATHERSNAKLVQENLLQGPAAAARFVSLYRDLPDRSPAEPESAAAELEADLPQSFDAMVLGMGADGHTASFFPGGDRLAEALDPAGIARVLPMRAPGAGEPRITLTLPVLLAAHRLYLHIEGAEKQTVLQQALSGEGEGKDYPVRTVLAHVARPIAVFSCP
ncbi:MULTISPECIES: 6-phosphogluconolactonase [unclassified Pseudoxanthomonas]|uniref:6-phosphogluconolactonase n=1 Tax=unclassified Pseudoxanthomonas TaxID=2645906 RepID=UPI003077F262